MKSLIHFLREEICSRPAEKYCTYCGQPRDKNSRKCQFCGQTVRIAHMGKVCSICGEDYSVRAKYCGGCGKKNRKGEIKEFDLGTEAIHLGVIGMSVLTILILSISIIRYL